MRTQDLPCGLFAEEGRYCSKGEATGCQGHQCKGKSYDGIVGVGAGSGLKIDVTSQDSRTINYRIPYDIVSM